MTFTLTFCWVRCKLFVVENESHGSFAGIMNKCWKSFLSFSLYVCVCVSLDPLLLLLSLFLKRFCSIAQQFVIKVNNVLMTAGRSTINEQKTVDDDERHIKQASK